MLTDVVVWEYPSDSQQGRDFLALLAAIRIHLPEDRYLLTAALPAARPILQHIDLRRAAEYVDVFNMTAYDFFGSWTPRSGHHAQLYSANKDETSGASGVQYMMASGVAGKKILLGIPLFGRSFLHVAGPGHKMRGVGGADGTFEYNQLPRKGTKEQVDKRAVAAQCVGGDGGFVTYDNPDTVRAKAAFCKQKGLGVCRVAPCSSAPFFCLIYLLTVRCRNRGCFTGARRLTQRTAGEASSQQDSRRYTALDDRRVAGVFRFLRCVWRIDHGRQDETGRRHVVRIDYKRGSGWV